MIFSVEDISKMLKVNKETVRRWCRNGKIKATQHSKKEGFIVDGNNFKLFLNENLKYKKAYESQDIEDENIKNYKITLWETFDNTFTEEQKNIVYEIINILREEWRNKYGKS